MTAVAVYLAVVVAFAALCCGHVGEDWPLSGTWAWLYGRVTAVGVARAVREVRPSQGAADGRTRPRAPSGTPCAGTGSPWSAPHGTNGPDTHRDASSPSSARTARPAPAWARTDKDAA